MHYSTNTMLRTRRIIGRRVRRRYVRWNDGRGNASRSSCTQKTAVNLIVAIRGVQLRVVEEATEAGYVYLPELDRVVHRLSARSAGSRGVAKARLVGARFELEWRKTQDAVSAALAVRDKVSAGRGGPVNADQAS